MRHYNTPYYFRLGQVMHVVMTLRTAQFLVDPPEPPEPSPPDPVPVDPPDPAPSPDPEPPPNPEPIPLPPEDPPLPPDPDPLGHDDPVFAGAMVLANIKDAASHEGRWWWRITDDTLDQWQPEDARHLLKMLGKIAVPTRGCVAFTLSKTRGWWDLVAELAPRGLLILG